MIQTLRGQRTTRRVGDVQAVAPISHHLTTMVWLYSAHLMLPVEREERWTGGSSNSRRPTETKSGGTMQVTGLG